MTLAYEYVVIAPDALALDDLVDEGLQFRGLIELFYEHGVGGVIASKQHSRSAGV